MSSESVHTVWQQTKTSSSRILKLSFLTALVFFIWSTFPMPGTKIALAFGFAMMGVTALSALPFLPALALWWWNSAAKVLWKPGEFSKETPGLRGISEHEKATGNLVAFLGIPFWIGLVSYWIADWNFLTKICVILAAPTVINGVLWMLFAVFVEIRSVLLTWVKLLKM